MKGSFTNTGSLVRFILRRERVVSAVWILALVLFSVGLVPALGEMFGGVESRANLVGMLKNPSMIAMVGPAFGHDEKDIEEFSRHKMTYQAAFPRYTEYFNTFSAQEGGDTDDPVALMARFSIYLDGLNEDDPYKTHMRGFEDYLAAVPFELSYNTGALYTNFMLLWVIITVGIMNIFLIARHTRGDEEKGRGEVVLSLPVGRLSNLNASMITAVIVNTILALLTGLGIAAMGVEGVGFAGSMLYGVALGVSGLFFAAVAALFCQLSSSSRGAISLSVLALGVIYMLRAAGDMNGDMEALSYISPMGLIQRSEIFVENYLWPSLVVLLVSVVITSLAYALNTVRDLGQGFIAARPGRKEASPLLSSPFGLAFRLLRNSVIAWFVGIFAIGAAYGSILGTEAFEGFMETNEFYSQIMGVSADYTATESFVSTIGFIMAFIAIVPVLIAALKLRGEEKEGRTEHMLSRAVSRAGYLSSFTVLAFLSSVLMQCATALGVYSAAAAVLAESPEIGITLGFLLRANLVYLPAIWVMIGVTVLLVGLLPKASGAIWGYYGLSFFLVFIGRLPGLLPEWAQNITPFAFIPQLPMEEITLAPLAVLTALAAVLTAAGFIFYRRRDMLTV
ncbi:MAG: ABC transporter permease [Oscillospiraceae bacterium]|jgi:ABC-2 type transport system permease protein|nr:ABC transporter permease [Oscillospiraceae bacterium]